MAADPMTKHQGEGGHTPGLPFEDVADEVLATLEPTVKRHVRRVADDLYTDLLDTVQEYLADDVRFNIASRLDSAERARRDAYDRAQAAARRVIQLESFVGRIARFMISAEWEASRTSKVVPAEAVAAMDKLIVEARALLQATHPESRGESCDANKEEGW